MRAREMLGSLLLLSLLAIQANAQSGASQLTPQPAFAPLVEAPIVVPRVSAYAVWQLYGVDRQGYFRARVAYQPGVGSYYVHNGQPYHWMTVHPLDVQSSAVGPTYRLVMPYCKD